MLYGLQMFQVKNESVKDRWILGYFTKERLNDLENIVRNNITDIWETCYNYAVIFKVPENVLYFDSYKNIYKSFKVVVPEHLDLVSYQEVEIDSLPQIVKEYFTSIDYDSCY